MAPQSKSSQGTPDLTDRYLKKRRWTRSRACLALPYPGDHTTVLNSISGRTSAVYNANSADESLNIYWYINIKNYNNCLLLFSPPVQRTGALLVSKIISKSDVIASEMHALSSSISNSETYTDLQNSVETFANNVTDYLFLRPQYDFWSTDGDNDAETVKRDVHTILSVIFDCCQDLWTAVDESLTSEKLQIADIERRTNAAVRALFKLCAAHPSNDSLANLRRRMPKETYKISQPTTSQPTKTENGVHMLLCYCQEPPLFTYLAILETLRAKSRAVAASKRHVKVNFRFYQNHIMTKSSNERIYDLKTKCKGLLHLKKRDFENFSVGGRCYTSHYRWPSDLSRRRRPDTTVTGDRHVCNSRHFYHLKHSKNHFLNKCLCVRLWVCPSVVIYDQCLKLFFLPTLTILDPRSSVSLNREQKKIYSCPRHSIKSENKEKVR
ncbi:unnamed protein product, partial [Nesidiocoris tenuis]